MSEEEAEQAAEQAAEPPAAVNSEPSGPSEPKASEWSTEIRQASAEPTPFDATAQVSTEATADGDRGDMSVDHVTSKRRLEEANKAAVECRLSQLEREWKVVG